MDAQVRLSARLQKPHEKNVPGFRSSASSQVCRDVGGVDVKGSPVCRLDSVIGGECAPEPKLSPEEVTTRSPDNGLGPDVELDTGEEEELDGAVTPL